MTALDSMVRSFPVLAILMLGAAVSAAGQPIEKGRRPPRPGQPSQVSPSLEFPAHPLDLILCRPTRKSVTLSVLASRDADGSVSYGESRDGLSREIPPRKLSRGEPAEFVIGPLRPDTRYFYRFRGTGLPDSEGTFHTQRATGREFTFTVTADSHLDDRVSARLYRRTLDNALSDAPDFHVDLGDTFMTDKHEGRASAARQYLAQRYYFGQMAHSVPLFLVLGNHDGESPRGRDPESADLAIWSNRMRTSLFPGPVPDSFYTGNAARHPRAGLLQDYYAWEWGDALFVVLDPFWYSQRARGRRDNWRRSLGEEQYRWLGRTLSESKAPYKFVFIHHLVGGATPEGRGGVEAAGFYEWGGKDADGTDRFRENRPGWPEPIHALLVRHGVSVVFHGHDHLFVKQQLDGIVYQEVPQPGTPGENAARNAAEYGYKTGIVLGSPGHVRVRVAPAKATVEYVSCSPEADDQRPGPRNRTVSNSYSIAPSRGQVP
ncbi:MAG: metallophosphoesterase [Isosphaeraceae bacterium]